MFPSGGIHSATTPLLPFINQLAHVSVIRKPSTEVLFCHSGDLPGMSVSAAWFPPGWLAG